MMDERLRFTAPLFEWEGKAAWFFVILPVKESAEIADSPRMRRGFGSVRVRATVGETTWTTSVFPQAKTKTYMLPMKKAVRVAENLEGDDLVTIDLELLE